MLKSFFAKNVAVLKNSSIIVSSAVRSNVRRSTFFTPFSHASTAMSASNIVASNYHCHYFTHKPTIPLFTVKHRYYHDLTKVIMNCCNEQELNLKQSVAKKLFENALLEYRDVIKQHKIPVRKVFISHAWGSYDIWVENLAKLIRSTGTMVSYDKTDIPISEDINSFVAKVADHDRILILGTKLYRKKATTISEDKNVREPGLVSESRFIINNFSTANHAKRKMLLPVVLEGNIDESYPPLMFTQTDLAIILAKENADYFLGILDVLDAIYEITPQQNESFQDLQDIRKQLLQDLTELGANITQAEIEEYEKLKASQKERLAILSKQKIRLLVAKKFEDIKAATAISKIKSLQENIANKLQIKLPKFGNIETSKADSAYYLQVLNDIASYINENLAKLRQAGNVLPNNSKAEAIKNLEQVGEYVKKLKNLSKESGTNKFKIDELIDSIIELLPDHWSKAIKKLPTRYYRTGAILAIVCKILVIFWALYNATKENEKERTLLNNYPCIPKHIDKTHPRRDLELLKAMLENDNELLEVAIVGFLGTGKTELAKLYADFFTEKHADLISKGFELIDNSRRPIVVYLQGKDLENEYKNKLAKALGVVADKRDIDSIVLEVNQKLKQRNNCLIIIDDIHEYNDIAKYLNFSQGTKAKIIITTRNTQFYTDTNKLLNISRGLELNEAAQMLQRISEVNDENGAKELVQELDLLPLAISTAALYIKNQNHGKPYKVINFAQYKQMASSRKEALKKELLKVQNSQTDYPVSQSIPLQILLENLCMGSNKDKALYNLMRFCSLISASGIPNSLLNAFWQTQLHFSDSQGLSTDDLIEHAQSYGLINLETREDSENDSFYYVHQVTQQEFSNKNSELLKPLVLSLERVCTPSTIFKEDFIVSSSLASHMEKLLQHLRSHDLSDARHISALLYVKSCLANYYNQIGKYERAQQLLLEEKAKIDAYYLLRDQVDMNNPEAICESLVRNDAKLPRRYAQLIYFLFRTNAIFLNKIEPTSEENIDLAIAIGEFIDNNKKLKGYDDSDNPKCLDTDIYRRQGKSLFHIVVSEKQNSKILALQHLKTAEGILKTLLAKQHPDNPFNIFCYELLGKVYFKKAKLSTGEARNRNLNLAVPQFSEAVKLLTADGIKSSAAADLLSANFGNLDRAALLLDTLGDVYLVYNDSFHTKLAMRFFAEALKQIRPRYKNSHIDINIKLAKLHLLESNDDIGLRQAKLYATNASKLVSDLPEGTNKQKKHDILENLLGQIAEKEQDCDSQETRRMAYSLFS